MAHVLVLGAGFGGLTAATELRRRLPKDHRITIVDQKSHFLMGLAKLWAMDGRRALEAGRRPLAALKDRGIDVVRGGIERIHVAQKVVLVGASRIPYDHLVVALGAETWPQGLEGFERAHDVYSETGATNLGRALNAFAGGRILFLVSSMPFKCPPAPYEAALLVDALLRKRGLRSKAALDFVTPEPHPLPVAPPEYGQRLSALLGERQIAYHPGQRPKRVDVGRNEVEAETGQRWPFDLLVGIPAHRAPEVLKRSGLTDASGWVPVDALTLRTPYPDVWAVGDCTFIKVSNGKPLPKAGILAEGQAKVAAERLAAEIEGRSSRAAFDGKGFCFLEVGEGRALEAHGEFYATPNPTFRFEEPSAKSMTAKQRFEADRLSAWFGS